MEEAQFMKVKLHAKDMKILQELDFGARQPVSRIAKKIGLSPEVTAYRIKQLEKRGIITGYYPVIDSSKLGYLFFRCLFKFDDMVQNLEKELLPVCKKIPEIGWFIIRGNLDVIVAGYVKSVADVPHIIDTIMKKHGKKIKDRKISFSTKIYHFRRKFLYGAKEYNELIWGNEKQVSIDETDKKILFLITRNIHTPATEIAKSVGLTSMAVINRIKQMEKTGLIQGYRCAVNFEKLGYTYYKVELYMNYLDEKRKKSLVEFLRIHPHVIYITEVLSNCDIEFEILLRTLDDLYQTMMELRKAFPEIRRFTYDPFHKEIILRYVPLG